MSSLSRAESQTRTRHRIRKAAMSEFVRRGIGAVSICRISASAGFSRGAFYANYASKRELLLELVHESHLAEVAIWTGLIEQAPNLDQIMGHLAARFDRYSARPAMGLLQVELQLEASRDATFGALYREHSRALMLTVEALVRSLFTKSGRAVPGEVAVIAQSLRALTLGLVLQDACAAAGTGKGQIVTRFLTRALESVDCHKMGDGQ